jgi:2-oxoglutarate ferredoxin oxidoreductase subunit gamma
MGKRENLHMVVLGAYLKAKPVVKMESVDLGAAKIAPPRHHNSPAKPAAIKKI